MFTTGLSPQTQKNLEILSSVPFIDHYYLAGGTALSLYFGHRYSYDLDFFSQTPDKSIIISSGLKDKGKLEIFQNDEGTFNGQLNGVKLSFFIYPYKLLEPPTKYQGIKIASISDIACMKLDAISSRGTKRDFIDLYYICHKEKPLKALFLLFDKKYHDIKYNKLHLLKSLTYFEDAQDEAPPVMIDDIRWQDVKLYFEKEAIKLLM